MLSRDNGQGVKGSIRPYDIYNTDLFSNLTHKDNPPPDYLSRQASIQRLRQHRWPVLSGGRTARPVA